MRRIGRRSARQGKTGEIVIVSGLPRSGTSLMMRMLEAGGLEPHVDGIRSADRDNPRGYYELERAKKLSAGDTEWLDDATGKAVKIIAMLLYDLPSDRRYKVVFMRRRMEEILASQRQMLVNRGEDPDAVPDADMARFFTGHLTRLSEWVGQRDDLSVLDVDYNDLVEGDTRSHAESINAFLGGGLDVPGMVSVVEPNLYRQRGS